MGATKVISQEYLLKRKGLKDTDIPANYDKMESYNGTGSEGGRKLMSDHINREEYEDFKNHLDTKFDRIIDKLDENRREIKDDIITSRQEMKDDINEFKNRTLTVFGLAVAVVGIIVPIVLHFI